MATPSTQRPIYPAFDLHNETARYRHWSPCRKSSWLSHLPLIWSARSCQILATLFLIFTLTPPTHHLICTELSDIGHSVVDLHTNPTDPSFDLHGTVRHWPQCCRSSHYPTDTSFDLHDRMARRTDTIHLATDHRFTSTHPNFDSHKTSFQTLVAVLLMIILPRLPNILYVQ